MTENIVEQMRADWNARAAEDANYYVAFGRRDQDEEGFDATGEEIVHGLRWEMRRLPEGNPRAHRALEIGCGPGRLLKPMSQYFGEIHGVDISDQMVERARGRLRAIPHAHAHVAQRSNLEMFADESFDFVYSYAVFQHIPSRDVVLGYLREARRVLKTGGLLRCQINGLPETAARYDTWSGVRISAVELEAFSRETDLQMLALEGVSTQYMWTTLRKQPVGWYATVARPAGPILIRRITNAETSEPLAPARGRYAALALWVDNLPADCDLLHFEVTVGGQRGKLTYIGPRERDGLTQVNLRLPAAVGTGLQLVQLGWKGAPLGAPGKVRIIPPPALVPRLIAFSDGVNLVAGARIETRSVKLTIEEVTRPEEIAATVDGLPVENLEFFCTDPLPPRFEVNFRLPAEIGLGGHVLRLHLGRRLMGAVVIEVVA
jgi:ubiquinone/menaquinone biosynthesis C-methylase UbiE